MDREIVVHAPSDLGDRLIFNFNDRTITRVVSTEEKWASFRAALRDFVDATFAAIAAATPEQREAIERAHVFAVWQFANDPSFPLPLRRLG